LLHGRTKLSVQVRGFLCEYFITRYVFTVRSCKHLAQPPNWRTTPFRLSATHSVHSHLPSILEAVSPSRNLRTWHAVVSGSHLSRLVTRFL
jgi:hypothetical protein